MQVHFCFISSVVHARLLASSVRVMRCVELVGGGLVVVVGWGLEGGDGAGRTVLYAHKNIKGREMTQQVPLAKN